MQVVARAPEAPSPASDEGALAQGAALAALAEQESWDQIVLGANTVGMVQAASAQRIRAHAPNIAEETLRAFGSGGKARRALQNNLGVNLPVVLFRDADWTSILGSPCGLKAGWTRFRELYPGSGGVTYLGSVGVSADGRQALTYLMWTAGPGRTTQRLAFLEKAASGWGVSAWIDL